MNFAENVYFFFRKMALVVNSMEGILVRKKETLMTKKMDMYLQCLEIIPKYSCQFLINQLIAKLQTKIKVHCFQRRLTKI